MPVHRLSGAEQLGVPMAPGVHDVRGMYHTMLRAGIEPVLVQDIFFEDITPPYVAPEHFDFRFYLSSFVPGEAVVDLEPTGAVRMYDPNGLEVTALRLPQGRNNLVICGPSPKYPQLDVVHEMLVNLSLCPTPPQE